MAPARKPLRKPHNFIIFVMQQIVLNQVIGLFYNFKETAVLFIHKVNAGLVFVRKGKWVFGSPFNCGHFSNHHITA